MAGSSHLTQRWGKEQAAGDSGGPTEELCGGSGGPGRFTGPGACSIKREWKTGHQTWPTLWCRHPNKANLQRCFHDPKIPAELSRLPRTLQHDCKACSPSAVCGLFTLWVLPVSWENIPGQAEQCSWKEKDMPALSVFLCISRYGKGSGVAVSGEAKCLCLCRAPVHQQFLSGLWKWKGRI